MWSACSTYPGKENFNCVVLVILYHPETTVLGTGPISGEFVLSAKHRHDMFGVLSSLVFDAKVGNYKAESDGEKFVHEQTRGFPGLMVS